jgi:hypothetical protein
MGRYQAIDVAGSFEYIAKLPEDPSSEDILDLANQVLTGILAWSAEDQHLEAGLEMGVYAEYLAEMMNK